jgi:hypothetical protein
MTLGGWMGLTYRQSGNARNCLAAWRCPSQPLGLKSLEFRATLSCHLEADDTVSSSSSDT